MPTDRELYLLHGPSVMRFAASLLGPVDAPDVVHDAMASLLASGVLAEADNPRALMYRAVLARARSFHRASFRRRRRERRFASNIVVAAPDVMPEVARAVAALSSQQRACVFLTYWEDMSLVQIADHLGIAEGTVKQHLARARRHLKEVLDD